MASPKLTDKVIISSTLQGTGLIALALCLGHDGLLLSAWLAVLGVAGGVAGGIYLAKHDSDSNPPPL